MNPAISDQAGMVTLPYVVDCTGPTDEISMLGGLCGASANSEYWDPTSVAAGMGMAVGPDEGPLLLLFDRFPHDPGPHANVAGQLDYAAYVVFHGLADGTTETLDQWHDGEAVKSGTVVTQLAQFQACGTSWVGQGTFLWRSTTIQLAWAATNPC